MYFKWTAIGLLVWFSFIGDFACFGRDDEVEKSSNKIMELFYCDDVGNMD